MKIEEAPGCTQAENNLGVVINHHKLALTQRLPPKGAQYRLRPLVTETPLEPEREWNKESELKNVD